MSSEVLTALGFQVKKWESVEGHLEKYTHALQSPNRVISRQVNKCLFQKPSKGTCVPRSCFNLSTPLMTRPQNGQILGQSDCHAKRLWLPGSQNTCTPDFTRGCSSEWALRGRGSSLDRIHSGSDSLESGLGGRACLQTSQGARPLARPSRSSPLTLPACGPAQPRAAGLTRFLA